jgi:hypothetical protein
MPRSNLLEEIEENRKEMITLSRSHSLTSDKVIATSTKLDQLIMKYLTEK